MVSNNNYLTISMMRRREQCLAMKQYSTSATLLHEKKNNKILNPFEYQCWSKEEVCSLFCVEADLNYDVSPLYDTDFDGTCLDVIVSYINNFGVEKAITLTANDFPCFTERIVSNLVYWVEQLIKRKLYHLWSIEQVREHLLKEWERGLLNINDSLLEKLIKGDQDAFERLNEIEKDLVFAWKESFNISVPITFSDQSIFIPDSIIAARTDPKFEYLRDLKNNSLKWKELESKIGQNIELPIIGGMSSRFVPKDYEPSSPYVLTKQSFDILKRVVTREQDGFVLSGPIGISKSYVMLLIVVYVIVNSLPLLYVPKFALCVFNFDPKENDFLKESALHFNSDILSKAQLTQLKRTDNVVTCLKSISTDFDALYYLFDEHHEIYEVKAEYEKYFNTFKGWTLETTCEKSVTIYSGSAHSKFEDTLPKEDMSRVIRITPPTFSEFETLVENFGYGKLDEESLFKIEYATGRIPKEIRIFSLWYPKSFTDNDIRMFISRRREVFYQRLRRMQKLYESETQNFITTIHRLFNMAFLSDSELTSRSIHVDGPLYDVGLLFKNSDNEVFPITEGAKHALFSFYIDNCNTSELNSLEDGCTIRRRSIFNEYKKSDFHTKFLLTDGSSAIIKYNISSHSCFDLSTMDMVRSLSRKRWLEGDSILFIPKSQQFPVIDYLIVTYGKKKIQIVLKKAISTVNEHQYDQSDLRELFKLVYLVGENQIYCETSPFQIKERSFKVTKEYCYSLFELIVHSILDNYNSCSSVVLQVEKKDDQDNTFIETKQTVLRRKVFKYKPTTGRTLKVKEAEISWYFVYETIKTGQ